MAVIFLSVGSVIIRSSARTEVIVQEAEAGIVSGKSANCAVASASSGQAVRFGYRPDCTLVPTAPPPTPVPAGQLIGWGNVINGPGGAWHRLAKLADGTWLRVLTAFPSPGRSELHIYKSTDNARTWTKISEVNDGNRLVDNGFLARGAEWRVAAIRP